MKNKYRLVDYDVWGNEEDGYTVNQAFFTNSYFEVDNSWSDKKLVQELKGQGLIRRGVHTKNIDIEGDGDEVLYFSWKGRPQFELRKEVK